MNNAYAAILLVISCIGNVVLEYDIINYQLDDESHCKASGVELYFIGDNDTFMIYGESDAKIMSLFTKTECEIKFAIKKDSKKHHIQVQLQFFQFKSCEVLLRIAQSPSTIFFKDVEVMAFLNCDSLNPSKIMKANKDNSVMISLEKSSELSKHYIFRLNITLSHGEEEGGMTMGITIGIIIICVTALIVLSVVMIKIVRNVSCKISHNSNVASDTEDGSRLSPTVSYSAVAGNTETSPAPNPLTLHGRTYDPEADYNYADIVIADGGAGRDERERTLNDSSEPNQTLEYISNNMQPPSYDEAVSMPKPGSEKTSPQYQNLCSLNIS